ncbi:spartin [Anaeramoeba flamelloides]|uniref:Spartin n=1 Tax=Anaeramoeba flamelloides TaxID=1746091 RepID=A0ABQ8XAE5_9EUKA|nr:spartin [Anaeramoeba flamelloides]
MNNIQIIKGKLPKEIETEIIFRIPSVQVFKIEKNTKEKIHDSGELAFVSSKGNDKIVYLQYFEYFCPITKETTILRVAPFNYVLPLSNTIFLGTTILEKLDKDFITLLEQILENCSKFIIADPLVAKQNQKKQDEKEKKEEIEEKKEKKEEKEETKEEKKEEIEKEKEIEKEIEEIEEIEKEKEEKLETKEEKEEKLEKENEKEKEINTEISEEKETKKNKKKEFWEPQEDFDFIVDEYENSEFQLEKYDPKKQKQTQKEEIYGKKIRNGGKTIRNAIIRGAIIGGEAIKSGGNKLTGKIKKKEKETEVSEKTKTRVKQTKMITEKASKITGTILKGIFTTASALGKGGVEMIKDTKFGEKISDNSGKKTKITKNILVGTLEGGLMIFDGIIDAGKILIESTGDSTTQVMKHRYGEQVGEIAKDSTDITVNVYKTGGKVAKVTKKVIANTVIENAGEEWINEERENDKNEQKLIEQNKDKKNN